MRDVTMLFLIGIAERIIYLYRAEKIRVFQIWGLCCGEGLSCRGCASTIECQLAKHRSKLAHWHSDHNLPGDLVLLDSPYSRHKRFLFEFDTISDLCSYTSANSFFESVRLEMAWSD